MAIEDLRQSLLRGAYVPAVLNLFSFNANEFDGGIITVRAMQH